jgi:hypothetical protein
MDELNESIFETEYENEAEQFGSYGGGSQRSMFSQEQELELAMELLTVGNEQELEQFLGDLFKKVSQGIGKAIKSPVGQALGGLLKKAAKAALPIAGSALGGMVGGPIGAKLGGKLASAAGQFFGLELEGMSGEDRELEVAQRVVRLAADAAQQAAQTPPGVPAQQAARAALAAAAARHAPGLLNGFPNRMSPGGQGHPGPAHHGTWVRRRGGIFVLGA